MLNKTAHCTTRHLLRQYARRKLSGERAGHARPPEPMQLTRQSSCAICSALIRTSKCASTFAVSLSLGRALSRAPRGGAGSREAGRHKTLALGFQLKALADLVTKGLSASAPGEEADALGFGGGAALAPRPGPPGRPLFGHLGLRAAPSGATEVAQARLLALSLCGGKRPERTPRRTQRRPCAARPPASSPDAERRPRPRRPLAPGRAADRRAASARRPGPRPGLAAGARPPRGGRERGRGPACSPPPRRAIRAPGATHGGPAEASAKGRGPAMRL